LPCHAVLGVTEHFVPGYSQVNVGERNQDKSGYFSTTPLGLSVTNTYSQLSMEPETSIDQTVSVDITPVTGSNGTTPKFVPKNSIWKKLTS
jgi:hypothetical protein